MSTEQIAVRVPTSLLARLDELVKGGLFESRAEALRAGIELLTEIEHRREVDRAIVDGYRREPQTSSEELAALASLRDAISAEPW
ncbi:MAG: ribbon-helix-helix domain-containing protein [Actinomycetota bacterium]